MTGTQPSPSFPPPLAITPLGEAAWLCLPPEGPLDIGLQARLWALAALLDHWPQVREVVPGMNNLLVLFDPFHPQADAPAGGIADAWRHAEPAARAGEVFEVPVTYGGTAGEDLAECAAHAGLSPEDFVRLHAVGEYTGFTLGSHPGFAYLGGLDPRLAVPRRAVPRQKVAAGVVMIGGSQTGVQACDNPTGWNLIGRTEARFFDSDADPPAALRPGMRVRFVAREIVS